MNDIEQGLDTCPHGYPLRLQDECPDCRKGESSAELEAVKEEGQIRELARRIENLSMQIDDKANLILTRAGLKPATTLDIVIRTHSEEGTTEHMNDKQLQEILSVIEHSELPCQMVPLPFGCVEHRFLGYVKLKTE